ncbi:stage II sporulation protein M [Anaerotignum sp.]|uniref:stage II sporulation protein M n=1 Tax=Anaerotignum sp. TaxID=2039241 RepID=UPI00289B826C|nr:stage II sporulation protein M [Anaerotignum sp.]
MLSFVVSFIMKPDIMELIHLTDKKFSGVDKTQSGKFLKYVVNNGMKVPFQMLLLALIPNPFVYYLPVALTSVVTGVIFYFPFTPQLDGKISFSKVFLGVFPHATIELFSFIIILAVLYPLNQAIHSLIFNKVKSEIGIVNAFKKVNSTYCFVAFPLLVLAAFIKGLITPIISLLA